MKVSLARGDRAVALAPSKVFINLAPNSRLVGGYRKISFVGHFMKFAESKRGAPRGSWLEQMMARKPRMLVTVALAKKTARIVWALLMKNEDYTAPVAAAA